MYTEHKEHNIIKCKSPVLIKEPAIKAKIICAYLINTKLKYSGAINLSPYILLIAIM